MHGHVHPACHNPCKYKEAAVPAFKREPVRVCPATVTGSAPVAGLAHQLRIRVPVTIAVKKGKYDEWAALKGKMSRSL